MSKLGELPITIPSGVDVVIDGDEVTISGPKGALGQVVHSSMNVALEDGALKVSRPSDGREHRALHGLTRSLLSNMVDGVSQGFVKTLDLVGVGYRAQESGDGLTLNVMLSHPVEVKPLAGVNIELEGNNRIYIRGADKQSVGQLAAQIRAVRPPNAYTGKCIRYSDDEVRIKPGKSARRVI